MAILSYNVSNAVLMELFDSFNEAGEYEGDGSPADKLEWVRLKIRGIIQQHYRAYKKKKAAEVEAGATDGIQ